MTMKTVSNSIKLTQSQIKEESPNEKAQQVVDESIDTRLALRREA